MMEHPHYPTPEEIRAFEQAARRERSEALAAMCRRAARGLSVRAARAFGALAEKLRRADPPARHGT